MAGSQEEAEEEESQICLQCLEEDDFDMQEPTCELPKEIGNCLEREVHMVNLSR